MQVTLKKAVKDFIDKLIVSKTCHSFEKHNGREVILNFRKGYKLSSLIRVESEEYISDLMRNQLEEYLTLFVNEINLTEFAKLREIKELEQEEKCK